MARMIATSTAVAEAANQLIVEGKDATVVAIQKRTGGSYTTVKRFLDEWRTERERHNQHVEDVPSEILAQAEELIHSIWSNAAKLARQEHITKSQQAQAETLAYQQQLSDAEMEVARLESQENQQQQLIVQLQEQLHQSEIRVVEAQTLAQRVPALEDALADTTKELKLAQREAKEASIEAAKLSGEISALRTQLAETLKANKTGSKKPTA